MIQPGRAVDDVIKEIWYAQMEAGSEEQQISIGFGQPGAVHYSQHSWGNTDLRRFLSIGTVLKAYLEAHAIVMEARRLMEEHCKPGLLPKLALKACDDYLVSAGCPAEALVCGHGQGLDLLERPVFRPEEVTKLDEGMIVCLHPTAKTKKGDGVHRRYLRRAPVKEPGR